MLEANIPYLCHKLRVDFTELAEALKIEMEKNAFLTADYERLRIEYNFLNSLVRRIENEAGDWKD